MIRKIRITILDQNLINKKEGMTAQEEKAVHGQMYTQSSEKQLQANGIELGSQICKRLWREEEGWGPDVAAQSSLFLSVLVYILIGIKWERKSLEPEIAWVWRNSVKLVDIQNKERVRQLPNNGSLLNNGSSANTSP